MANQTAYQVVINALAAILANQATVLAALSHMDDLPFNTRQQLAGQNEKTLKLAHQIMTNSTSDLIADLEK